MDIYDNFSNTITNYKFDFEGEFVKEKSGKSKTKLDKFIYGVVTGAYKNDEEAAKDLYNSTPQDKSYQMLKSRSKDRLVSHLLRIDVKKMYKFSKLYSYMLLTYKYATACQFMLNLGISNFGDVLLKQSLYLAKKYQMPAQVLATARLLRSRAGFKGTRKEIVSLDKTIDKYSAIYLAELEAESMRDNLNIDLKETFTPQKKEKVAVYWKRIKYLNEKYESYNLKVNKAKIGTRFYEANNNYRESIKVCDEFIAFIINTPLFYDIARHREYLMIKLEAYLLLKDFDEGKKNAEQGLALYKKNNVNILVTLEWYILLCIHSKDYKMAWELFDMGIVLPVFKGVPPERMEIWKLFEAYLCFAAPINGHKFKLYKYLNEISYFSKDKRGLNISITIVQIVLLLDEGNFDRLIDRADSFKIYFKRYVNRNINYRTFYFVKLLELLFRYNFNEIKIKAMGIKYYKKLGNKAGHYKGNTELVEIIPYEELWQLILKRLNESQGSFVIPVKKRK